MIEKIVSGYHQFQKKGFRAHEALFSDLSENGQNPKAILVGCADSRVDPSLLFGCKPGDLFVVRNVANLVPPYEKDSGYHGTSAALEFSVCALKIPHIILLGHTQCGGIAHLLKTKKDQDKSQFVSKWMKIAEQAKTETLLQKKDFQLSDEKLVDTCSQLSLINSLKNLLTFPWIAERVAAGNLSLHAWQFNIKTGSILQFDQHTHTFLPL